MDGIITNSGLVTTVDGRTYLTDIKNYSGTAVVDMFGNVQTFIADALMWYSLNVGNYIFFSNQKANNVLSRYDVQSGRIQQVSEIACKNMVRYGNDIFFIDENSKKIMTCGFDGTVRMFADINAELFTINGNVLYHSSAAGIGRIDINTKKDGAMLSSVAQTIGCWNNMLIYSDFKDNDVICVYNLQDGSFFKIESVNAESIATYGNYIFATNRKDGNSIFRIDISKGEIMRVYGERAYNLHITGTDLYFTDADNNWCRMSVTGDNFMQIKIN